jgi:hypothetical protein
MDTATAYIEIFQTPMSYVWLRLDQEGRPFGEASAHADSGSQAALEIRRCPYTDAREGEPMNVSALKQLNAHWSGILEDLAYLRSRYYQQPGPPTLWSTWNFGRTLVSLPGFLIRRGMRATDVPGRIAGLFKAAQGLFLTTQRLFESGNLMDPLRAIDTEQFLAFTMEHKVLFSGERVCSGPPGKLRELLDIALTTSGAPAPENPWLEALIGDVDAFLDYGDLNARIYLAKLACGAEIQLLANRLAEAGKRIDLPKAALALWHARLDEVREQPLQPFQFHHLPGGMVTGIKQLLGALLAADLPAQGLPRGARGDAPSSMHELFGATLSEYTRIEDSFRLLFEKMQAQVNQRLRASSSQPGLTSQDMETITGAGLGSTLRGWLQA